MYLSLARSSRRNCARVGKACGDEFILQKDLFFMIDEKGGGEMGFPG